MAKAIIYGCAIAILVCPLAMVSAQETRMAASALLTITSIPAGADVMIDGKYVGPAPLRERPLEPGLHTIVLKLRGFITVADTIEIQRLGSRERSYAMHPACSLSVTSDPPGGAVYVNNVFRGLTPCVVDDLEAGAAVVAVSQRYYFTRLDTVTLSIARLSRLSVTLRVRPATVSVETPDQDVDVFINDRLASHGALHDTTVVPGDIEIRARKLTSDRNISSSAFLLPASTARFRVQYDLLSSDPLVYSLMFPGLGQTKAGSPALGLGLNIAFTAAVGLALGGEIAGAVAFNDYSSTRASYTNAMTKADAMALHATAQQQFDRARSGYRLRNVGVWTALVIYLLSAADAWFIHNRMDVIQQIPDDSRADLSGPPRTGKGTSALRITVAL